MSDWYGDSIYSGEEPLDYIENITKKFGLNNSLTTKIPTKFKEINSSGSYTPYIHQKSKFNEHDVTLIKEFLIQNESYLITLANSPQKLITLGSLLMDYECELNQNLHNSLRKASKSVMDYLNNTTEKFITLKYERLDLNREFYERIKEIKPKQNQAVEKNDEEEKNNELLKENVNQENNKPIKRKPKVLKRVNHNNKETTENLIENSLIQNNEIEQNKKETISLKKKTIENEPEKPLEENIKTPKPRKPRVKKAT